MAANVYECMVLLDNNKVAGDLPAVVKQLHGILERNHAEVLASRTWADQKLAYPINGHKKGLYYLICFRTEGKNIVKMEQDFKLFETMLRVLILRVDRKHIDPLLELARNEHAFALQTVNEPPPEDDLMPEPDRGGHRRGGGGGRRSPGEARGE
jgi:small subunit ribosomal protein S6